LGGWDTWALQSKVAKLGKKATGKKKTRKGVKKNLQAIKRVIYIYNEGSGRMG